MSAEVVVTGMGAMTPIGQSVGEVLESLLAMRSGVHVWEAEALPRTLPVASVAGDFDEAFKPVERPFVDRTTRLGLLAAEQAMAQAGLSDMSAWDQRAGVFVGTVRGGGITEWEHIVNGLAAGRKVAKPFVIMATMNNAAASQLSIRKQILGPSAVHTTACSSSGSAVADACRHIASGELDVAIVGGTEAALHPLFIGAWEGLRALAELDKEDPSRSCKPFSKQRSGLVLGEGSVMFVLESREHAVRRGARILGVVEGWGIASDAYHIGAPNKRGQLKAMQKALHMAGVEPSQVDYVNAHATATRGGDIVEAGMLRELLGDAVSQVPVSGTKSVHGHMLGAASAMEMLVCLLAIQNSFLPATAHLDELDEECSGLRHVRAPERDTPVRRALSLSAGFGGSNCALLVRSAD